MRWQCLKETALLGFGERFSSREMEPWNRDRGNKQNRKRRDGAVIFLRTCAFSGEAFSVNAPSPRLRTPSLLPCAGAGGVGQAPGGTAGPRAAGGGRALRPAPPAAVALRSHRCTIVSARHANSRG